jgi:hypothetical protein
MALSTAEILKNLGATTEQETESENESETPEANHALAERHLDWLLSGGDDTETESAPINTNGGAGHRRASGKRKLATAPDTKTTVEQNVAETTNRQTYYPTRPTFHMTVRRISHNGQMSGCGPPALSGPRQSSHGQRRRAGNRQTALEIINVNTNPRHTHTHTTIQRPTSTRHVALGRK